MTKLISRSATRLSVVLGLFVLLSACTGGLPTVVVDEAHFTAFKQGELEEGYKLAPAEGFTLDATGYPFVIPAESPAVPGPNMIQVTTGEGQVYSHPWDLQYTRYTLTAENLVNTETGEGFPGLAPGESYLLGVGFLDSTGRFTVLWAAVVDVKAS